jgi:hypothetical protein
VTEHSKLRKATIAAGVYTGILLGTLVLLDLTLIALGLFPPVQDYGDEQAGWLSARPTGEFRKDACLDLTTMRPVTYLRNEDGLRTSHSSEVMRARSEILKVAVSGDSHTELCNPNHEIHFGVMERELVRLGWESAVFSAAAGKYSPLQAYLSAQPHIERLGAHVFVLNFYTGNDFLDMMRIDDRPHFRPVNDGYELARPIWYQMDPPGTVKRSRVLFAARSILDRLGVRNAWVRVRYLRDAANEQGQGWRTVFRYMNDLRRSMSGDLTYPASLSAQMLNQQLFFEAFPGSLDESVRRVEALLEWIRREHPDLILIVSPIPSYQLVGEQPVDSALFEVVDRLPVTYETGVREEAELYQRLRSLSEAYGWLFVDNLPGLREYDGPGRLYNDADYHILPVASEIVGRNQAEALDSVLTRSGFERAVGSRSATDPPAAPH